MDASNWRQTTLVAAAVAGLFVAVATLSGGLIVLPVGPPLDPALGLVLPLSLALGPAGVVGATAGVVLTAALRSALALLTVVDAGSVAALGYLAYRLWGVLPAVATGRSPRLDSLGQVIEFLAVALLAVVTAVSALAWGQLLVQGQLFHSAALAAFPTVTVSTLLVGPPVLLAARGVPDSLWQPYEDRTPVERGTGGFRGAVLVPVCWLVVGTLLSVAATLVQSIGGTTLAQHGYGFVFVPFDPALVGAGARRVQVVFGAVMLSLILATWLELNRNTQPGRCASTS
jgi:hypothetical protein